MNTRTPHERSSNSMAVRGPVQADLPRDLAFSAYLSDEARDKSKILIFPLLNSLDFSADIDQISTDPDRPWGKLIEFRLPRE
jgi:hypothetical protein